MTLYDLIKVIILLMNAVVILNERFFRQVGWFTPQNPHTMASSMDIQPGLSGTYSPDDTLKQRLFTIFADQSVKSMLRSILIPTNALLILLEFLVG